jgi:hypothetical protein
MFSKVIFLCVIASVTAHGTVSGIVADGVLYGTQNRIWPKLMIPVIKAITPPSNICPQLP